MIKNKAYFHEFKTNITSALFVLNSIFMRLSPKQVTPFFWIRSNIGELAKMRRQEKVRKLVLSYF